METGTKGMTAVVVQIKRYHYVLTLLTVDMKEENGFENMWKTKSTKYGNRYGVIR